jgi:UDPglucose 6-dehydrogenase
MKYQPSIGIIGYMGMVGGTTYRYFKDQNFQTSGYDLRDKNSNLKQTLESDFIFICVPTPFNWETNKYDDSIVQKVLDQIPKDKTVIIKSTIQIGSTEKFQSHFPNLKLLFNPEFLSEATCDEDFRHPDRQFVGYTDKSKNEASKVLNILPAATGCGLIMPSKQAELLKYINNMHGSLAVMEFNHYYEVCQKENIDYDSTIKAATASKYLNPYYTNIWHKDYRGFGGKCFPKDINAWIQYLETNHIDETLFKAVRDMNRRILKEQNLTEIEVEKK